MKFKLRNYLSITISLGLSSLLLSSCTTTGASNSSTKSSVAQASSFMAPEGDLEWWSQFGDSDLDSILKAATAGNLDLANMVAHLKIVEESLALSRRNGLPTFMASASGSLGEGGTSSASSSFQDSQSSVQMAWEIDIWGRLKDQTAAQLSEYQATQADLKSAYLSIVSNISSSYIRLRQFDEQTGYHKESIVRNQDMLKIYKEQAAQGRGTDEQVLFQEAEILRLESELEELTRQRSVELNLLAELSGQGPGSVQFEAVNLSEAVLLMHVPENMDTSLLEARPDLIALDARVKKAYFLESSAKAARMPRISFGGMASIASSSGNPSTWAASVLPQISFPGMDPATKTDARVKQVEVEIAENNYKKGANAALSEAANAYLSYASHLRQYEKELLRLEKLETAHEKVVARFTFGRTSQLEVFESERQLLGAQQTKLGQIARLHQDVVSLYVALGQGW